MLLASAGLTGCLPSTSEFEDKAALEDAVGMKLPNFSVKKYAPGMADFHGDYEDTLYIEFETKPSKALIDSINKTIEQSDSVQLSRWRKEDEHNYYYRADSQDGGRVPECRTKQHDWYVVLKLADNSKDAKVIYGYW